MKWFFGRYTASYSIKVGVVGKAVISPSRPYRVTNSSTAFSTSASGLRPISSIPTFSASSTMSGASFKGL